LGCLEKATCPQVRSSALIAFDQMDKGNLARDQVTPLLNTDVVS
jgi:hypothetical protein